MGLNRPTSPHHTILTLTLILVVCALSARGEDVEDFKSNVYFKAIYDFQVHVGPEDRDRLVKEIRNIIFEENTDIPRHYYLPMNSFRYITVINLSGLNATLVGNPSPISAVRSNGIMVDGVQNSVVVHRSATHIHECFYDLTYCRQGFTIGFWVNFPNRPQGLTTVMSSGGEDNNHGFSMTTDHTGQMIFVFKLKTGREWKLVTSAKDSPILLNKWYHFLVTWSTENGVVFYINGQPVKGEASHYKTHETKLLEPRQFWIGRAFNQRRNSYPTNILLDEIHFWMDYKTQEQVQELGPVLFYRLPIGTLRNFLAGRTFDGHSRVRVGGRPKFIKDGKTEEALEFDGRSAYVAEDVTNFCFHNASSCFNGFLISTWIKFTDLSRNGVIFSTGDQGFKFSVQNGTLVYEVFVGDKVWKATWSGAQAGQWYFVDLSYDPSVGLDMIFNHQIEGLARYKRERDHQAPAQTRGTPEIYVGRSSKGEYGFSAFTVDDFEIWYGDLNMLTAIGYIMRGKPGFFHLPMDEISQNHMPHHHLNIDVHNSPRLVAGKVKSAVDLNGQGQYLYISPDQQTDKPCFNNLNFCKHGSTISMWLKPHDLVDGRHFLSTGAYGFNMWQEGGMTKVTARLENVLWLLWTDKLTTDKWQFLEITYDPSSHSQLKLYIDGVMVSQSDGVGTRSGPLDPNQHSGFYIGRGDGTRVSSHFGHFSIDEMEYWLAGRDYLIKYNYIQRGQLSDYIHINMDELRGDKMTHKTLKNIKVINNPTLTVGRVNNALELKGKGQYLDLGKHKDVCLGNLAFCQDGMTNSMWVKLISMEDYAYLMSSGKGLQIFSLNKQLVFVVDVNGRRWEVAIPGLKLNKWYFVEYTWHPSNGLQVYINNRLVGSTTNYVTSSKGAFNQLASFKIGSSNQGEVGQGKTGRTANMVVDEFEFWYNHRDALIASGSIIRDAIKYILFPFEHQQGTIVPHPDFNVNLHNGARITPEGRIGNGLLLAGREEYVTFGDQSQTCMGNLLLCPKGLTISMHLKPNSLQNKASVLAAAPYHIYTDAGRLHAEFSNTTHIWRVSLDRGLRLKQWQQFDFSWHPVKGLMVYQDDRLVGSDQRPQVDQSHFTDHNVYLGRSTTNHHHNGFHYSDVSLDELQYWYASRDLVDTDPVINKVILDMDVISDTRLLNPYTAIMVDGDAINVPAINSSGVKLNGHYQYLSTKGSQLVCHGNLENCQRGFTFRLKLKPDRLQDNVHVFSSGPFDLFLHKKRLNAVLKTPDTVWKLASKPLEPGYWYQIDVSWSPQEGAEMFVNGERGPVNRGSPNIGNTLWSFDPSKDLSIGGNVNSLQRNHFLVGVLDDLQMWHARRDILLYHNLISRESFGVENTSTTYPPIQFPPVYNLTNYRMIFDGQSWAYYDLSRLPTTYHTPSQIEQFSIKLRTRDRDGLIYFNGDDANNVQLIMKDGYLYLVTVVHGREQKYQIGQDLLNDGRWHQLHIEKTGRTLRIQLDHNQGQVMQLDHMISFLQPRHTYLGGTNHNRHTIYYVKNNFRGDIKDIWLRGNQHPHTIYLSKLPFTYPFPSYVNTTGNWRYEKEEERIQLVTPPIVVIMVDADEGKKPKESIPITFHTGQSHLFLGDRKPADNDEDSFELKYRTTEPNAILVHLSKPQADHDAVIELFDGKPYLVANFGRGHRRVHFGSRPQVTNDNREHFVKVASNRDSLKLTLDQETYSHHYTRGHNKSFELSSRDTRIFLGGAMENNRVPWDGWSRKGFKGCVWNVRFNREDDLDLRNLVAKQGVAGIVEQCRPSREECSQSPCLNNARCLNTYDSHVCDCSDTPYHGDACEHYSKFVSLGDQDKVEFTLQRPISTHTNDLSLRFRTIKENALLFSVNNQANNDVIRVNLERGVGKVETRFKGENRPTYTKFECDHPLNDNHWHTVHIKRRANHLEAWVDNCARTITTLPEKNFDFAWDKVTLGHDARNSFVGHLQNFMFDRRSLFYSIDHNNNPNIHIYTTVRPSDRDDPIVLSPITIHRNHNAYLTMDPLQITGGSKLQVMFKTPDDDGVLLYNPGAQNDFFAVEVHGRRLWVRGDDSTGQKEVVFDQDVSDNKWHSVEVQQSGANTFDVVLDAGPKKTLQFEDSRHTLDLNDRLYVGYVADAYKDRLASHTRSQSGFAGCLASLVVNRQWYDLDRETSSTGARITSGCTDLTRKVTYCVQGICKNNGACEEQTNGYKCNCDRTSFVGDRCDKESEGLKFGEQNRKGIVVYNVPRPSDTEQDTVAFGFMTYAKNGTLVRMDGLENDFTEFKLVDGRMVVVYKVGGARGNVHGNVSTTQTFNDGVFHRALYVRNHGNATLMMDDQVQDGFYNTGNQNRDLNTFYRMSMIKLGGDLDKRNNIIKHYNGILSGVHINGIRTITEHHEKRNDVQIATHPFKIEKITITVTVKPIDITKATLPPGVVTAVTPFGSSKVPDTGGGVGWDKDVIVGEGEPKTGKLVSGMVPPFGGPGAAAAGGIGAMIGLLLLSTSAMWALYKFKPGLLPGWGKGGGVGGGAGAPLLAKTINATGAGAGAGAPTPNLQGYEISGDQRVLALNQDHLQAAAPESVTYSYERSQTFTQQAADQATAGVMGMLTLPNVSMRNVDLSYGGFNQQDVFTQQQQQRMQQQQQQLMSANSTLMNNSTMGRNYMAAEEIRVDCVQMTNNGRYVVTGSNCGPPQVWDLKSGELVRVMRGDQFSSTDLHLANGDTLLVGQVAELEPIDASDVNASNRIHQRKMQLWDFETGKPHEMHRIEMCTASCMMNDGERIVLGRTDKYGGGTTIVVYDLLSKEPVRTFKCDSSFGFADHISYLNVSKDNRYIIAGFQNSYDSTANYATFDLASNDTSGLKVASLDAPVEVTAVLNDNEAVTGTRRGELIVWSMKNGQLLRTLGGGGLLHAGSNDHHGDVKDIAVSRDGQFLVSASSDGSLKVWDVESEQLMHTLIGHKDEVWCCCLSPDNELVGSGSKDGTIRMWKVSDGSPVAAIDAGMTIFKVLLSNNKKTVVALGDKGGARKLIMLKVVRSTATIDRRAV